ncbi:PHD and RING finger domain-containing protein 1 isoform X2 [Gouania willdenowi]|uniref:PHD and RING finger domain-containing protein 1 isoform X2 n=1 Tax=Gouania willdenowi TaxID=441366 RepID=UPI0010542213|nr:PHD and RING finger domain-containing protein 1 isoform X2 [Gouania willdenowi]
MDEDDSQDELINHSRTQSKRKRAVVWAISDDSDESEEGSEEGESDSGEEDHINGEEEEEEDDDEEEEEEEGEDIRVEGGAPGGPCAVFGEMSSDEDAEKCPICLNSFTSQPVATPENCEHYFCFDCILEWAKNSNSCPVDRSTFNNIYLRRCFGGKLKKVITVQKPVKEGQEEVVDLELDQTNCEVCGGSDREDRLLLCDGCDAGYHMECLLPPLDSVPVEEWFCPECEANNRQSRNPDEELGDVQSVPSTARPATSQSHPRTAGPTRAIARTQQSERVRASVNRNRITQLAPTYLIQSSWLDETINAVVAGLNTAVYVRDLTPRVPTVHRRKSGKRRRVRSKKTSSAQGVYKKAGVSGVRRRKRRRRTKSKRKMVLTKVLTPRSRIANNLGIVKDKKSSSLPTVYRPSENTLSNMRADIGAASLSIYGDPYDLDPLSDREEIEQQARIPSLLEAKRRGISHSALRSHQPVARPFTTGLSRRHVDVGPAESVVEVAPVPDLLGSILTGQSMLLMDSSDVVINRDGTLKSAKPVIHSALAPSSSKNRSSGEESNPISSGLSPNLPESSSFLAHNNDIRPSNSSINRPWTHSSSGLSSSSPFSSNQPQQNPHKDFPNGQRHTPSSNHQQTNRASLPMPEVSSTKSKTTASSQAQNKKAPLKPMWEDVSCLPKIPKIKRENSSLISEAFSRGSHSRSDSSNSVSAGGRSAMPESSINSLSGDKGRQQSVDQPKSQTGGHSQRERPNRANSSSSSSLSSFSNSFSSSTSSQASQSRHAASSSSSSSSASVSFRINSSGNSWQARRLNVTPSLVAGGGNAPRDRFKAKEEEVKNRQLHRDKQLLLASRTSGGKEQDNIYDPFNPTASDSNSSDEEIDGINSHDIKQEEKAYDSKDKKAVVQSSRSLVQLRTETEEVTVSQEEPSKAVRAKPLEVRCSQDNIKNKKESTIFEPKSEKQAMVFDVKVKKEQLDEAEESNNSANTRLNTERAESTVLADHRLDQTTQHEIKTEMMEKCSKSVSKEEVSRPSTSITAKNKPKEETKPDVTHNLKSPQKDAAQNRKTSKPSNKHYSSSSESELGRRGDHCATGRGDKLREKETQSSSSQKRRRVRSSDSSQPNSPERTRQKRRQSRSRSKDKSRRSRSRSASSSSSRERLKRNEYRHKSREGEDGKERHTKEKRRGRPRSKSRSRSRSKSRSKDRKRGLSRSKSRSRSRERRKDHTRTPHSTARDNGASRSRDKRRHRSRSNSRERRKDEGSSNVTHKTSERSVSSSKDVKHFQEKRKEKVIPPVSSIKEEKVSKVSQREPRSSASKSGIKLEEQNPETTSKASTVDMNKDRKPRKEIKKEKQTVFDMFEESPNVQSLKKEPLDMPPSTIKDTIDPEVFPTIKSESCDLNLDKSEPDIKELCQSPPISSISVKTVAEPLQVSVRFIEQQDEEEFPFEVKQEKQQTSDYDDDLDVDMEVDNLANVKSEQTEDGAPAGKQVKEVVEEEKKEERLLSVSTGAKTKTQVKRVTWNIQEPEGPQPEKSASKVALYKMKLKQEGIRRPSLAIQTSNQDPSSTPVDQNKKAGDGSLPDSLQSEELSAAGPGEPAEGDGSRKDKYLKKLHMQERAVEEVKLAIKPYYQGREINKEEYKEILRKAVQKVCHSKSGEINPIKVGNLVKAYVDKYKHARKPKKEEESEKPVEVQCDAMIISDSP